MVISEKTNLVISIAHLEHFEDLVGAIYGEFYRFEPALVRIVTKIVNERHPDYARERTFTVGFTDLSTIETLRDISATKIGTLTAISGTVTRTTEVRPELLFATFRCEACA
jgi:DNA replication licensing factor MCM6